MLPDAGQSCHRWTSCCNDSKCLCTVSLDNVVSLTQTKLQSCLQCIIKGFRCTLAKCHSSMFDSSNNYNWSIICKARSLGELFCPAVLRHCMVQRNYPGIPKPQSLISLFDKKGHQDSEEWSDLSTVTLLLYRIVYGLDSRNSYALIWCFFSKFRILPLERRVTSNSLNVVKTRNDFIYNICL